MADILEQHGYKDVYVLEGGFDTWKVAGMPLEPK
jgi:rhodanese-related sulfurtransferase